MTSCFWRHSPGKLGKLCSIFDRRPNIRFKTAIWYVCCIIARPDGRGKILDASQTQVILHQQLHCWFLFKA